MSQPKSWAEQLFENGVVPISVDLYQKYKITFGLDLKDLHDLSKFLTNFQNEYEENKGKSPSRDFIIQKGSEWIKNKEKK